MRRKPLRLGSISLLFAVILACTALLALLGVVTARADWLMTEKYAARVAAQYEHEAEVQRWLAQVDEALAAGSTLPAPAQRQGQEITALFTWQDGCQLEAALHLNEAGGYEITAWKLTTQWTQDTSLGQLWGGPGL